MTLQEIEKAKTLAAKQGYRFLLVCSDDFSHEYFFKQAKTLEELEEIKMDLEGKNMTSIKEIFELVGCKSITTKDVISDLTKLFKINKGSKSTMHEGRFYIDKNKFTRHQVISFLREYFKDKFISDGYLSLDSITLVFTTFDIKSGKYESNKPIVEVKQHVEIQKETEVLEQIQEAIVKSGGSFFKQSELRQMSVEDIISMTLPNGVHYTIKSNK